MRTEVGLADAVNRRVGGFSRGMLPRLGLTRAKTVVLVAVVAAIACYIRSRIGTVSAALTTLTAPGDSTGSRWDTTPWVSLRAGQAVWGSPRQLSLRPGECPMSRQSVRRRR